MMFIIILIISLQSMLFAFVSGASVAPSRAVPNRRDGCTLILPSNLLYAPVVTDENSREQLVPVEDKRSQSRRWYVHVARDREIRVNCGRGNTLNNHDTYYYQLLTCVRGTEFRDNEDDEVLLPDGIGCSDPRKPTPIIHKNGTCAEKGTNFDVEFLSEIEKRKFYSVCMDEETSGTLYSTSFIDGARIANGEVEGSGNRPQFRGEEFYPFPIKQAYKWENLHIHLSELLGSEDLVAEYFPTQQHRFSRGHLFPNADPIKQFEKHATFYYINTVPQWQLLNGGNWATIEQDVRDLAANLKRTLNVITGAFGITTLVDANNNAVQIWLARDRSGKLRLPIPRIVWKVVHDPVGNSAVAIVQVNNPWLQLESSRGDILCQDICDSLAWLRSPQFHVTRKGYTYCCDVNELRRKIPYVPQLAYKNLLITGNANNGGDDGYDSGIESGLEEEEDEEPTSDYSDSSSSSSGSSDDRGYQNPEIFRGTPTRKHASTHTIEELFASIKLGGESRQL